jgi:hypothetical protein
MISQKFNPDGHLTVIQMSCRLLHLKALRKSFCPFCLTELRSKRPQPQDNQNVCALFCHPIGIFNASFVQKVFPKLWKEFYLAPIPKVEPCTNLDEIRPIALTSRQFQKYRSLTWLIGCMTILSLQFVRNSMVVSHARQQFLRSFTFYTNGIKHWTYHNE